MRQTFAGVVSLLNDYLLSKGKAPLGFLNPLLYSKATSGFNDITSGSNPGCGTNGFSAGKGWDPVSPPLDGNLPPCLKPRDSELLLTGCLICSFDLQITGLGTPDFLKLKKLVG